MQAERISLLLIEDNPADLRLVAELLEEAAPGRFRVEPARQLAAGLKALRAGLFAAVILDLSLPDADGVGAIAAVREAAPSVPVIVLSGMLDSEVRRTAAERGRSRASSRARSRSRRLSPQSTNSSVNAPEFSID